jgi:hypothetical protein
MNISPPEEHVTEYKSLGHMIDGYVCSCGWASKPFFDGAEYAKAEAERHVKQVEKDYLVAKTLGLVNG